MFYIACTRFNNSTFKENINYRKENNIPVIYGSALKIRKTYKNDSIIFVAEMNNDLNKIEGIGLIRNNLVHNRRHKIYEHIEYNRYIYEGNYWLDREMLGRFDPEILLILDSILFKGKSHLKCRSGISIITEKLFTHWPDYKLEILKDKLKQVFICYFKNNQEFSNIQLAPNEEILEIIPNKKKRRLVNQDKNIEK